MNKTTIIKASAVIGACLAVIGIMILYFVGRGDRRDSPSADKRTIFSEETRQKAEQKSKEKVKAEKKK